jgi:4-hydroxy-2-oxoheptanedioate aldolase
MGGAGGRVWFAGPMPLAATFRSRLVARETLYGAWSVIPSPLSVRLLAAAGLDYVVIDLQHGGATEADLPAMTSAVRLAGATPIARVRHAHAADIGRALDLGCEGVIVPNVDSVAQARQVAGAVRYPPAGYRSAGGVLATPEPFCLVMVESAAAVAELDGTLALGGVDGIYVGPRDLSLSLGCELDPDDPVLNRALQRVWAACAAAGKPVGVHATEGATARRYRDAGCTLITTAADAAAITRETAAQFTLARA